MAESKSKSNSLRLQAFSTNDEDIRRLCARVKKRDTLRAPSCLQRIFHRVTQADSLYYPTKAKSVDPSQARDVCKESTPYQYPSDEEQFAFKVIQKAWKTKQRTHEMNSRYCDKTNIKSRQTIDLLERLYIEDPAELKGMKTLLDIDPEFYTIVEGRPTTKRFLMGKYITDIRLGLRTKLMTGFRNDETILINQKLKREEEVLESIRSQYLIYLNSFESFLNQDYEESMSLLRNADLAGAETLNKNREIRNLKKENAALEFTVHKLEERWRDLKMYQKFLYFISPMTWRLKYDYIHRRPVTQEIKNEMSNLFNKYTLTSQGQIPSLINLVDEYMDQVDSEEPPVLYFTTTTELIKVFRFIEIQNLNCLLHAEDLAIPMENMKLAMEETKKKFSKEAEKIQALIDTLTKDIEWEEACVHDLESTAMKHIDTIFKDLIASDDILKLHVFVEDVYEGCVAQNDSDMNIFDMMLAIEKTYNKAVLQLDGMPQAIVKKSEKYRFAEQNKLNKLVVDTAQKIALVDSITWRLKKSLEPAYARTSRGLIWRSKPPEKIEPPPPPPRELTKKEMEYLMFFTEFCRHADDINEYGIDLSVSETNFDHISFMNVHVKEY